MVQPLGFHRSIRFCLRVPLLQQTARLTAPLIPRLRRPQLSPALWRRFLAYFMRAASPCCFFRRFPSATFRASKNWRIKLRVCFPSVKLRKPVFDAQVAFNLLSSYGETSKPSLADTRSAVARDVARYLSGRSPIPALQFVQAPVFYGYAFSAYAELDSLELGQLESAFANLGVKVDATREAPPMSVWPVKAKFISRASGAIPMSQTRVWLWGIADNLRLPAVNAVRIAEALIAKSQ